MNVCVLGNSQAACVKGAWDIKKNRPRQYRLTFFAAFGLSLGNLEVDGDRLVPSNEALRQHMLYTAGVDEVVGSAYDAFLICGAGLGLRPIDARVSHQLLEALSADLVRASLAYSLAAKVRQITDADIYIMHSPLLDERTAGRARFNIVPYEDYFPLMERALDIPGAQLLRQPEQTITLGHYTKLEFSKDAVRLAVSRKSEGIQHKAEDNNHMNVDYGAVRLKDFFERLPGA